jgi:uncharacterized membrane protein
MATSVESVRTASTNWSTLGTFWVVYGIIRLVVAILLVLYSGVATVMFGALLARVADYQTFMSIFHLFYFIAIIATALSGLFGLVAGLSLLVGRRSARSLALVAGLLSVSDIPLGTTLGIYTLIIFLH